MAGSLSVVKATRKKSHGMKREHSHPVRSHTIEPTDNGGFTSTTQYHPEPQGENDPYSPGKAITGAHANLAQAMKHAKGVLDLKDDKAEGNGMSDPGTNAEDQD